MNDSQFNKKINGILKNKQNVLLTAISGEGKFDYFKNNILQDYDIIYFDCTDKPDYSKYESLIKSAQLTSIFGNEKIIFIELLEKIKGKMLNYFIDLFNKSQIKIIATTNDSAKVSKKLTKYFRKVKFTIGKIYENKEDIFTLMKNIFLEKDRKKVRQMLDDTKYPLPVLLYWLDSSWFKAYDNYDFLNFLNENSFKTAEKYIKDLMAYGIERTNKNFSIGRF